MGHARFQDIVLYAIIIFIAAGVYGIFFLLGLDTLGTVFAGITLIGLLILDCCWLPSYLNRRKSRKYEKKYNVKEVKSDNVKYCLKCGSAMNIDLKFCTKCGQVFDLG
ncbi:MAG: hypothetical protein HWN80_18635 [Candidatus Lokiarchaeota archaeon]|nr:hypothetical protein [Candidatus Lokiarchaeota archaeon]